MGNGESVIHYSPFTIAYSPFTTMVSSRVLKIRKRIALVAHDHKKKDLMEWAEFNKAALARHELIATGTTGRLLEESLDRPVRQVLSGPLGGDQ